MNNIEKEIKACKQAIRLNPDDAETHYNLGNAYHQLNDRDSALEQYKILKKLDTELANTLYDYIEDAL